MKIFFLILVLSSTLFARIDCNVGFKWSISKVYSEIMNRSQGISKYIADVSSYFKKVNYEDVYQGSKYSTYIASISEHPALFKYIIKDENLLAHVPSNILNVMRDITREGIASGNSITKIATLNAIDSKTLEVINEVVPSRLHRIAKEQMRNSILKNYGFHQIERVGAESLTKDLRGNQVLLLIYETNQPNNGKLIKSSDSHKQTFEAKVKVAKSVRIFEVRDFQDELVISYFEDGVEIIQQYTIRADDNKLAFFRLDTPFGL